LYSQLNKANPFDIYSYGIEPDFIEYQILKFDKFNNLKSMTKDNYEDIKKTRLAKWLTSYQERLKYEYENRNNLKSNIPEKSIFNIPLSKYAHNMIIHKNLDYSSTTDFHSAKKSFMNSINPKFILRNHVAQRAIEKAENGNYEELWKIFKIMTSPFDEHSDILFEGEYDTSTEHAYNICVSCSS
jgi:uncharacterized protein YdiU (UPF0061 family)